MPTAVKIVDIPAGATWPEQLQDTQPPFPFAWVKVENRNQNAGNDLVVAWGRANAPTSDAHSYDAKVQAGQSRTLSTAPERGDALPRELRITNLGSASVTAYVVVSTSEIVDRMSVYPGSQLQPVADGSGAASFSGMPSIGHDYVYNSTTWDPILAASFLDARFTRGVQLMALEILDDVNNGNMQSKAVAGGVMVSAANTQAQQVFAINDCKSILAVYMVASGGTATLTVEASVDNVNWNTIDSLAAAATNKKAYTPVTNGGTLALPPLAFRYIRITAGAAGAGFTTTTIVTAK